MVAPGASPAPPHASQRLAAHHTAGEESLQSAAATGTVLVDAATSGSQPAIAVVMLCPLLPSEAPSSASQLALEPATSPVSPRPSFDCPEPCSPEAAPEKAKGDTGLFRSRGTARQLTAGAARLRTLKLSDFLENNIFLGPALHWRVCRCSVGFPPGLRVPQPSHSHLRGRRGGLRECCRWSLVREEWGWDRESEN
ncbi:unnamed protein product [Coccothraustes coccothraustes]